jgi:hypothetical protein
MSWATAESLSRNYSLIPAKAEKPNAVNEGGRQSLSTLRATQHGPGDAVRLVVGCEAALPFQGGKEASAAGSQLAAGQRVCLAQWGDSSPFQVRVLPPWAAARASRLGRAQAGGCISC